MTWIRWEVDAPRSDVVGFLADRLDVEPVHALGHYNALCCGFGEHVPSGRVDQVPDATLELWGMWRGKRGRLAAAVREWCAMPQADGTPSPDPGKLRGWWRNEAVLRKQKADAGKPDGRVKAPEPPPPIPPESPADPARDSRGILGGNEDDDGNGSSETSSELHTASSGDAVAAEVQVAIAANRGLRRNARLPGFNELLPQQAEVLVRGWRAAGIPLALICETVERCCVAYKPSPGNSQPTTFAYFAKAIQAAQAKAEGRAQLARAGSLTPTPKASRLREMS